MARKVKCFETGECGTNDTFFKAIDGHYYKDEETYLARIKRIDYRYKILDKLAEFAGYSKGAKFPTIVTKKLKELESYSNEVIYETICECESDIQWVLQNKSFNTDYGMFAYIMAIIINKINDVDKKTKRDKRNNMIINKQIENIDADYEPPSNKTVKKNVHDISNFLGDDLWN